VYASQARDPVCQGTRDAEQVTAAEIRHGQHRDAPGAAQLVLDLAVGQRGVERDQHEPRQCRSEFDDDPLETVGTPDGDAIAGPGVGQEASGPALCCLEELGIREAAHPAVVGAGAGHPFDHRGTIRGQLRLSGQDRPDGLIGQRDARVRRPLG
jgi:hypothetical protein